MQQVVLDYMVPVADIKVKVKYILLSYPIIFLHDLEFKAISISSPYLTFCLIEDSIFTFFLILQLYTKFFRKIPN